MININERNIKTYWKLMALVFVICAILSISAACTAQERASKFSGTITIDNLPDDICIINGQPQLPSLNIENSGDMGLTYINKDGDLITLLYGSGFDGIGTDRTGTFIFKGDLCHEER